MSVSESPPAPTAAGQKTTDPVGKNPRITAVRMLASGLWPVPIYPPGVKLRGRDKLTEGKEPIGKAWGAVRNTVDTLAATFRNYPGAGVGVALGPGRGSGGAWLIDVEGDGPEAEESRVRLFGGEVVNTLGWGSARGGHMLLIADPARVAELLAPLKGLEGKGLKTGVYHLPGFPGLEIRFGGSKPDGAVKQLQSVFPPTVGTDDKPRQWNGVAMIAPAPEGLYSALRAAAGAARANGPTAPPAASTGQPRSKERPDAETRAGLYVDKCDPAISGQVGHGKAFKAACKVGPGFNLPPETAFRLLRDRYNPRCLPVWTETELRHKVDEAYKVETRRGWLLNAGGNGNGRHIGNGQAPSAVEAPSPNEADDDPHRLARIYLKRVDHPDGLTLRFWREEWHRWDRTAYRVAPDKEVRGELTGSIKAEFDRINLNELLNHDGKKLPPRVKPVTTKLVGNVLNALSDLALLRARDCPAAPAWLCKSPPWPASEILPTRNTLVHLPGLVEGRKRFTTAPTPAFFCPYSLDFDFDPAAPSPTRWLAFLNELWPDDPQSIGLLQEWFGYLLTSDTSQQKMLMVIGPKRSGKGTIARVLRALIGPENVASPTLSKLANPFGLASLIGKTAAVIADARLSGRADQAVIVERLLSITGEDSQSIDRKHRDDWEGKLSVRFLLISNELPKLTDAAAALPSRMLILRLTQSFLGHEDTELLAKLLPELPGILLWGAKGWGRLRARGRFEQPESARELAEEMEALSSPINVFLRDRCEVGDGLEVETGELFKAWREWCEANGRDKPGTQQNFGRDLRTAVPRLKTKPTRRTDPESKVAFQLRLYCGVALRVRPEDVPSEAPAF